MEWDGTEWEGTEWGGMGRERIWFQTSNIICLTLVITDVLDIVNNIFIFFCLSLLLTEMMTTRGI